MANKYNCSNGEQVTQVTIDKRRSEMYREKYNGQENWQCAGCGCRAQGSAHIIPQARLKQIGKTELIWAEESNFPACNKCNLAIENPKGTEWLKLKNSDECIAFIFEHDRELYIKFTLNAIDKVL